LLDRYVAVDLETTGLNPGLDSIIEVGLVKVSGREIIDTFHTLVMPAVKLPFFVQKLTGIEERMLEGAPWIDSIRGHIAAFIEGENLLGHNAGFDVGFIESALGRPINNPIYDTLELSRIMMPSAKSYRLMQLCKAAGLRTEAIHRAMEDAMAVIKLFEYLSNSVCGLDGHLIVYLESLLKKAGSPWGGLLSGYAGISLGNHFLHRVRENYNQDQSSIYENSEPWGYVAPEEVRRFTSLDGALSRNLPSYEYRPQQEEMACEVARAFNEKKFLLVEAGTGTGKSISYLLPSLLWVAGGGPRVVISTRTINLQDQLWFKDIPQLMRCLGVNVKTVLAKGRSNYLCRRRWDSALSEGLWSDQEARFYARVLVWVNETKSGDKVELNLNHQEEEAWQNICAESENCMGFRCRHFSGSCFVVRARREAESSGLVITNHALLFSDIKTGNMVLPSYGPLIIDEAHHLEDAATEQLGRQVSRSDIRRWLQSAARIVLKSWEVIPPTDSERWMHSLISLREEINGLRMTSEEFFSLLKSYIYRQVPLNEGEHHTFRIKNDYFCGDTPGLPWGEFENLIYRIKTVISGFRKITVLMQAWELENDSWGDRLKDFLTLTGKGEELLDNLQFVFRCSNDSFVYWISVYGQGDWYSLSMSSSPVRVGELLYDSLFSGKESVIMTSATLTTNGSFDFFAERVGIDRVSVAKVVKKNIESPFLYESQSLLCVVNDLPLQGAGADRLYAKRISSSLEELILAVGGKTLVLFTSHRVLREVYGIVKASMEDKDIAVLGHNMDGNRSRLVEEFMRTERAVLMGSASFWEGIDIPGEALTSVIIVKLPFPSPSSPVIEARVEDLEQNGRSSFYEYYLPLAVIRFKQGFGRLIRSESDRGVVVVLDRRIIEKGYGKQFLNSLPVEGHFRGDTRGVANKIQHWMNSSTGRGDL